MKIVNSVCVFLVSAFLVAAAPSAASKSSTETEVLAAVAELDKAFVAGDLAKVEQIHSGDYLQTNVRGQVQDRETWFSEYFRPMVPFLRAGKTRLSAFERKDLVVRDFGDTAVVVGSLAYKFAGIDPSNPNVTIQPGPPRLINFTQVWIKRAGTWKLAVLQNAYPWDGKSPVPTVAK